MSLIDKYFIGNNKSNFWKDVKIKITEVYNYGVEFLMYDDNDKEVAVCTMATSEFNKLFSEVADGKV